MTGLSITTGLEFNGSQVAGTLQAGSDRAATSMGEHVLQQANVTVPLEEATLERSGRVSAPEDGAVAVYYDTAYAARQHEELDWEHDPGRRAKWLELTLAEERGTLLAIGAREMRL